MKGVQIGAVGFPLRLRTSLVFALVLAVIAAGFVASLCLGLTFTPPAKVIETLFGDGSRASELIVFKLRMPRALTGVLVGLAFGLAGALFQAVTRNPLASPDLIGVSAGASAGGVAMILFSGVTAAGAGSLGTVPFGAFAGALAAAAFIYVMAFRGGTVTGYRFVLVGIGVNGALSALTGWLLTRADIDQAGRAMVWLTGSLNGRGFEHATWIGCALAVVVPCAIALSRPYQLLQYGDDTARGLGLPLARTRMALLLLGVVLAAFATAAAGPIGFVALAAPQIARRLTGTANLPLLTSGLVGSALVMIADLIARTAFGDIELPVGVVTGAIGAPYLMWLLARKNRAGTGG
ncbi:iron ABC transporter permease [Actinorhabdospora filicis]|uniref:Iron ABC transporter permease n=1 Tax=Actinorhabdospora filicis TaxID=1785913 RepID=A0A9W6SKL4_9ACTN|nr:iron chelate uptake ABC transporter family permease subunit [Actinorhabdospora filicis]GLZ76331.1 iron ABC transporter permease [Actinorhabdospora filicis]